MDELKLNRLRKVGGNLILEEHSHCEVPAGCGGVVLRWVDGDSPIKIDIDHIHEDRAVFYLDGVRLERSGVHCEHGTHVLLVELQLGSAMGPMMALTARRAKLESPKIVTAADGSWLYREGRVRPEWHAVDVPKDGWTPLIDDSTASLDDVAAWQVESLARGGAEPLSVAESNRISSTTVITVRRTFRVSCEGLR